MYDNILQVIELVDRLNCGLNNQGIVEFPTGARDLSLLQSIQTASEAHPPSYSVVLLLNQR
jgi:hypothetical protein